MASPLAGKKVLVVEDDYFIASDLRQVLQKAGAEVVGPVGTLAAALALMGGRVLDAAVLDVNLNGPFSYPVADRLRQAAVPHLFITGYDQWAMPAAYRAVPRIGKPFAASAVVDMLQRFWPEEVTP